jgi:hypothetical protein
MQNNHTKAVLLLDLVSKCIQTAQYRAHTQNQCVMCSISILPLNVKVSLWYHVLDGDEFGIKLILINCSKNLF